MYTRKPGKAFLRLTRVFSSIICAFFADILRFAQCSDIKTDNLGICNPAFEDWLNEPLMLRCAKSKEECIKTILSHNELLLDENYEEIIEMLVKIFPINSEKHLLDNFSEEDQSLLADLLVANFTTKYLAIKLISTSSLEYQLGSDIKNQSDLIFVKKVLDAIYDTMYHLVDQKVANFYYEAKNNILHYNNPLINLDNKPLIELGDQSLIDEGYLDFDRKGCDQILDCLAKIGSFEGRKHFKIVLESVLEQNIFSANTPIGRNRKKELLEIFNNAILERNPEITEKTCVVVELVLLFNKEIEYLRNFEQLDFLGVIKALDGLISLYNQIFFNNNLVANDIVYEVLVNINTQICHKFFFRACLLNPYESSVMVINFENLNEAIELSLKLCEQARVFYEQSTSNFDQVYNSKCAFARNANDEYIVIPANIENFIDKKSLKCISHYMAAAYVISAAKPHFMTVDSWKLQDRSVKLDQYKNIFQFLKEMLKSVLPDQDHEPIIGFFVTNQENDISFDLFKKIFNGYWLNEYFTPFLMSFHGSPTARLLHAQNFLRKSLVTIIRHYAKNKIFTDFTHLVVFYLLRFRTNELPSEDLNLILEFLSIQNADECQEISEYFNSQCGDLKIPSSKQLVKVITQILLRRTCFQINSKDYHLNIKEDSCVTASINEEESCSTQYIRNLEHNDQRTIKLTFDVYLDILMREVMDDLDQNRIDAENLKFVKGLLLFLGRFSPNFLKKAQPLINKI